MRLLVSRETPRIKLWQDFASADECQKLIDLARPRLRRSTVLDRTTGAGVVQDARTSQGAAFAADETPLVAEIVTRAAKVLGVPRENVEPPQAVRYGVADGVGEKYDPHEDWFDPKDPGSAVAVAQGGQRTKTLLVYLNTPEAGGSTSFPQADIVVGAATGNAVQFEYPTATAADLCLHGGDPVTAGEKWALNVWARQRPFGSPEPKVHIEWMFNAEDCATLRAFYDARADKAEGGVDRVVRVAAGELQPFIDRVKQRVDAVFPEPKVVETVVLACMPAGVEMPNHADNVRLEGTTYVPNHTPNRTHTAVTLLQTGLGGQTHYDQQSIVVNQEEGRAHVHRCGPDFHHRVTASDAPRYSFVVWFKRPA